MSQDVADIAAAALPLRSEDDLDPLLERIGGSRIVLIGEATHGTSEFYRWRAALTRRLIAERGFSFVAVEGDWPDCHAVHCAVSGAAGSPEDPAEALRGFHRWPRWMWANAEVADFVRWLRAHNTARPGQQPVGFHGLDVYSLQDSLQSVLDYLREHAPEHVDTALAAFRCFEPYGEDPTAGPLVPLSCRQEVVALLRAVRERREQQSRDGLAPGFVAEQNAAVAEGAERYYRTMLGGGGDSWNVRDEHMVDTLDRLLQAYGTGAVVWEHNTHIGDAGATPMVSAGMTNVGRLVRERYGEGDAVLVGMGSYEGEVIAGRRWGATPQRFPVRPARPGSAEALMHEAVSGDDALFVFPPEQHQPDWQQQTLDHRAIGVVYGTEGGGYVPSVLGRRYDAFLHLDRTRALEPLHERETTAEEAETYPSGV
ncbi:erythromycin esterase-like protein [Halopolyspora algeriensis]|uniref:Erythromycin esterase-like protein n=1 Tax=Halopolyspora algeriensis TaxID=1500506 RepID=A0A368VVC5_9ACTN|nr:erythromycin esterase family protein [Halopolyspora algeriensis]RCW45799.1 erythromycin esterase-like protein [Halopolyspora algeriensis]TQM54183.1 erythromycin esterase-like protein [Halopolyspora algeriensis]